LKTGVKLKKIESLMVNWGSICINLEPRTKIKGAETTKENVNEWIKCILILESQMDKGTIINFDHLMVDYINFIMVVASKITTIHPLS